MWLHPGWAKTILIAKGVSDMSNDVMIEMMSKNFLVWRCLHDGPLTKQNVDQPQSNPQCSWPEFRVRNLSLLEKLTDLYGSCAVLARDGDQRRHRPNPLHDEVEMGMKTSRLW